MGPVREAYGGFFDALDRGEVDAAEIARVEADVAAGSASEGAYLALSSLAYGYYQLAQRAADEPDRDPEVLARLEAWNDLLSSAYEAHGAGDPYRDAVREAAEDVHRRAPAVGLRCLDEEGEPARCDSTEAVLRGLQSGRDATGVRGALGRMLGRLFGEGP